MHYNFIEAIEKLLVEQRKTKKSLYDHLGLSRQGFDNKLKNNTVSVVELGMIAYFFNLKESDLIAMVSNGDAELKKGAPEETGDLLTDYLRSLEDRFANLLDQLRVKDHQLESKDNQIAGLQRMLESVLGKPEGATVQPLYTGNRSFESLLRQYKQVALGQVQTPYFFLAKPVAKLVAPRCLV